MTVKSEEKCHEIHSSLTASTAFANAFLRASRGTAEALQLLFYKVIIFSVLSSGGVGKNVISFTPPLQYMHWGDDMESGVPGVMLFQKAEVALLTRNIYIQGQREGGLRNLTGQLL